MELDFGPSIKEIKINDLEEDVEIDPEVFQNDWEKIEDGVSKSRTV